MPLATLDSPALLSELLMRVLLILLPGRMVGLQMNQCLNGIPKFSEILFPEKHETHEHFLTHTHKKKHHTVYAHDYMTVGTQYDCAI